MAEKLEVIIDSKANLTAFNSFIAILPSLKTLAIGAGAAVAGMGAGLLAITKSTATAYDKVQKFADRIGISTEALSAYHHVANLSGVSIEALNMGFQRMTRRISEAEAGTGVAGKALEELGISIDSIAGQSPDKQFEIIAGALDGVAFQGDKARLAMQFFDSEGVALLQTLTNGTAGLEAMKAEAEKFGLVVSAKAGANAAAFNDSLTRLTGSFKGLKNYMAEQVMPTITALANRMADWVANNRDRILEFGKTFISTMGKAFEYGAYGVAGLIDAWRGLKMVFEVLKIGFSTFTQVMVEGLSFLTGKMLSFMEAVNVGGVFDGAIENVKSFQQVNEDVIFALEQTAQTAYANLNNMASEGLAIDKVADFTQKAKDLLAELSAEGDVESTGIKPFDAANTENFIQNTKKVSDAQKEAFDELKSLRSQYLMDDNERLQEWYDNNKEKYAEFSADRIEFENIFNIKKTELAQKQLDEEERLRRHALARERAISDMRLNDAKSLLGQMATLAKDYGRKGFAVYKAAAMAQATISAYQGAARAYADYEYPYSIIVSVLVAALGLAQVAKIGKEQYQAHSGLTVVPQTNQYTLLQGERVLSNPQNKDLTTFLSANQKSGFYVENLSFNFEITKPLDSLNRSDWESYTEEMIIPALSKFSNIAGHRPAGY